MTQEEERIAALTQRLQDHLDADKEAREALDKKLDGIEVKVDLLAEAFQQGRGMVKLLSWLAAGAATIATVGAFIKDFLAALR